jgi:hypothetical protein
VLTQAFFSLDNATTTVAQYTNADWAHPWLDTMVPVVLLGAEARFFTALLFNQCNFNFIVIAHHFVVLQQPANVLAFGIK